MEMTELSSLIALTLGVGWASGINLYAAVLALGLAGSTGYVVLPEELQVIQNPLVIAAAGFMYFVEFFADKTPGVDSGWDALHTFIRLASGRTTRRWRSGGGFWPCVTNGCWVGRRRPGCRVTLDEGRVARLDQYVARTLFKLDSLS